MREAYDPSPEEDLLRRVESGLHQVHHQPQNQNRDTARTTTEPSQQARTPNRRGRRRSSGRWCLRPFVTMLVVSLLLLGTDKNTVNAQANDNDNNLTSHNNNTDLLNEDSVVLITGMAGFLGSELALALHRIYGVQTILGIDSMDDGFGTTPSARSPAALAEFDVRRQRLFRTLQTLGDTCHFYRVDLRPNLPDFQDRGEVPVLDAIFTAHPRITHVVHLADPYGVPSLLEEGLERAPFNTQAIPRKKDQIKAGMMESILEQLIKVGKLNGHDHKIPHFTYASSSHVYQHYTAVNDNNNKDSPRNPVPFQEARPVTTPSSLHGASKLIDEVLARTYHQTHDIYSVGLRFFDVYGPWSHPGTMLYDLTERAVRAASNEDSDTPPSTSNRKNHPFVTEEEERILDTAARDYIYIDDAVDALLAAMQFRPANEAPPVVFNVGTGEPTTVRTIVSWIQQFLSLDSSHQLPAPLRDDDTRRRSVSYADPARARDWLGFEARVSLGEGLLQLLAWHHDRIFPYGSTTSPSSSDSVGSTSDQDQNMDSHTRRPHPMAEQGIVSCSPYDAECLKGAPVFPCASECSHSHKCTPSIYDAVLDQTRQWTASCEAVLYTVDLDEDLTALPSATAVVSTTSQSHVMSPNGQHCNLAFVSSQSPLVKQLQQQPPDVDDVLKHGFWTLVPVPTDPPTNFFLAFLPKLSPGRFFGGSITKRIIYCDPDVIIDSIPNLLVEAAMQPMANHPNDNNEKSGDPPPSQEEDHEKGNMADRIPVPHRGATAMLIGKGRPSPRSFRQGDTPIQQAVQETAYRSVRISIIDQISGDGFALPLDSSFIVHTLQSADSRLLRCDVFAELVQWHVGTDQAALEFVLELHDMWSRVLVQQSGTDPWWVGESVETVPEQAFVHSENTTPTGRRHRGVSQHRRLQEALQDSKEDEEGADKQDDGTGGETADAVAPGGAKIVKVVDPAEEDDGDGDGDDGEIVNENNNNNDKVAAAVGDSKADTTSNKGAAFESDEDNVAEDGGAEVLAARNNEEDKDDDTAGDDDEEPEDGTMPDQGDVDVKQRKDMSAYDTWMGVLSSSKLQYFVRIVPSSAAGVVVLDDYDY